MSKSLERAGVSVGHEPGVSARARVSIFPSSSSATTFPNWDHVANDKSWSLADYYQDRCIHVTQSVTDLTEEVHDTWDSSHVLLSMINSVSLVSWIS